MRIAVSYNESLFATVKLEDFVPAHHPLRPIRTWVNNAQPWASDKRTPRKDRSDDGSPPEDWRGEPRSNDRHESSSDPDSRLYRSRRAAPALPGHQAHVLPCNRHGLIINVQISTSEGTAERDVAAQMLADVSAPGKCVTVGTYNLTRLRYLANLRPQCAQ